MILLTWLACDEPLEDSPDEPSELAACPDVCPQYAECGCQEKCESWCHDNLEQGWCPDEVEALIACASAHPDPCSWESEPFGSVRCEAEINAFLGCTGNSFFPIPGALDGCSL